VQPPPTIELDDAYLLDDWRSEDAASHRVFAEDADAARFLGWTVEEARAAPDSYYVDGVQQFQNEGPQGRDSRSPFGDGRPARQSAQSSFAP
jgi:hypothetical protein